MKIDHVRSAGGNYRIKVPYDKDHKIAIYITPNGVRVSVSDRFLEPVTGSRTIPFPEFIQRMVADGGEQEPFPAPANHGPIPPVDWPPECGDIGCDNMA